MKIHPYDVQGSPDLKAAREVADFLGTVHHEFHFTVQVRLIYLQLYRLQIWINPHFYYLVYLQ